MHCFVTRPGHFHRLPLLLLAAVPHAALAQSAPAPLYAVRDLGGLNGSFAQAEGTGAGGIAVGQAQAIRYAAPTMVGTPFRSRQLSYFDPNEGYTNRQNIDILLLVYLLANPRYIGWYYSDRRTAYEHAIDERRGVVFTPPRPVGTPVVLSDGRARELPTPADQGGVALGRSAQGTVVGAVRYSPVSDTLHAACWLPDSKNSYRLIDLEASSGGGASAAASVSESGAIVGGADSGYGLTRAFRWAEISRNEKGEWKPRVRQNLGTLGGPRSAARAINQAGQIVGWAETAPGQAQGFLWEPSGTGGAMRPLDIPRELPNGTQTDARAIRADGSSVGVAYLPDGTRRAVRWNRQGHAVVLSSLPDVSGMEATAISETGLIVGFAYDTPAVTGTPKETTGGTARPASDLLKPPDTAPVPASTWAVVWDGKQVRDLNLLIDPRSGWILRRATGISDKGEIVGWGTYRGKVRAFRLAPRFASVGLP